MTGASAGVGPTIRTRIWWLAAIGCVAVVALTALVGWSLERNHQASSRVAYTQALRRLVGDYGRTILDAETGQRGYLLTRQDTYLTSYRAALRENPALLARLQVQITDRTDRLKLDRLALISKEKFDELASTIALARQGQLSAALDIVREGRGQRLTAAFTQLAWQISDSETARLHRTLASTAEENGQFEIVLFSTCVLVLVLIVGVAATTITIINAPLRELMAGVAALADGRLDRPVRVRSNDEVGRLAAAFNTMASDLLAAGLGRERGDSDLAASNQKLLAEVDDHRTARSDLLQSVEDLRLSQIELATSNEQLLAEVHERDLAQASLSRSVEELRSSEANLATSNLQLLDEVHERDLAQASLSRSVEELRSSEANLATSNLQLIEEVRERDLAQASLSLSVEELRSSDVNLAASNKQLLAEVHERDVAQASLSRSVEELRSSEANLAASNLQLLDEVNERDVAQASLSRSVEELRSSEASLSRSVEELRSSEANLATSNQKLLEEVHERDLAQASLELARGIWTG